MCGRPCFNSVFGLSLQKSVIAVGILELVITLVATILNVVKYARGYDRSECEGLDVCIGPLIKYSVFDALFGVVCALILIFGAHTRNTCLLISWIVVTLCASIKYLWVVITHDWTSIEDWISITYLLFYILVGLVVWSLYREIATSPVDYINRQHPMPPSTIVLQQTFHPPPQSYQQQPFLPHQQPPPYNPNY